MAARIGAPRTGEHADAEFTVLVTDRARLRDPDAQTWLRDPIALSTNRILEQFSCHVPCREHLQQRKHERARLHGARDQGQNFRCAGWDCTKQQPDREGAEQCQHRRAKLVERDTVRTQVHQVGHIVTRSRACGDVGRQDGLATTTTSLTRITEWGHWWRVRRVDKQRLEGVRGEQNVSRSTKNCDTEGT